MNSKGKELRRLCDRVSRLTWSPDSKEMVCLEYEWPKLEPKKVLRVDIATGKMTAVAEGAWGEEAARMGPDGKRIAFVRRLGDKTVILTCDPDGANVRKVAFGRSPRWSPDAKRLAFLDEKSFLWMTSLAGSEGIRLTKVKSFDWVRLQSPAR